MYKCGWRVVSLQSREQVDYRWLGEYLRSTNNLLPVESRGLSDQAILRSSKHVLCKRDNRRNSHGQRSIVLDLKM